MDATFSCVPCQPLTNPNDGVSVLQRRRCHTSTSCRLHCGRSVGSMVHLVSPWKLRNLHGSPGGYSDSRLAIRRQPQPLNHGPTSVQQAVRCQQQHNPNPQHGGAARLHSRFANGVLLVAKVATNDTCLTTQKCKTNQTNKHPHTQTRAGANRPTLQFICSSDYFYRKIFLKTCWRQLRPISKIMAQN